MTDKDSDGCLRDSSEEEDGFVHLGSLATSLQKSLNPSKDSLESDLQSLDSLQSITKSRDSLDQDDMTDSLEDLTCEFEESSLMRSMDQDLENVIAEATKLQTQVLESIIGGNEEERECESIKENIKENDMKNYSCLETSEVMEELESLINEHSSEKETFSKGIAAIIYEPIQKVDTVMVDKESEKEDAVMVNEESEKEEAIMVNEESEIGVENIESTLIEKTLQPSPDISENSEEQKISCQEIPYKEQNIEDHEEETNGAKKVENCIFSIKK